MKVINTSHEVLTPINGMEILQHIERVGRVCYKSEDRITEDSCIPFVAKLIKNGHEAMIEHNSLSVKFICDRGVSHELVRHRIASFAQESTRYCNYGNDDNGCTFINPCFWDEDDGNQTAFYIWHSAMEKAEGAYLALLKAGASPQQARAVLPNSLKTEITITANLREWRHFFKLRTAKAAHPQMREITIPLLNELKQRIPVIFSDIEVTE